MTPVLLRSKSGVGRTFCVLHCLSCQKRFLWAHKAADLAPHPVVGLVLQVGDAEVSSGTWSRKLGSFSQGQQVGSISHIHRGSSGD